MKEMAFSFVLLLLLNVSSVKARPRNKDAFFGRCLSGSTSNTIITRIRYDGSGSFTKLPSMAPLNQKFADSRAFDPGNFAAFPDTANGEHPGLRGEKYCGNTNGTCMPIQQFRLQTACSVIHASDSLWKYRSDQANRTDGRFSVFKKNRSGHLLSLLSKRLLTEPPTAMMQWPDHTKRLQYYPAKEKKWAKVFIPKSGRPPGLNF